jgi:membrane associated rhomboid family serine protease
MTPVGPRCPDHATQGRPKLRAPAPQRARRRVGSLQRSEPIVTYILIGLNVLVYLITVAQGAGINNPGGKLFNSWFLDAYDVAGGGWWRLITAAFLHASILHIAMNMFVLYICGTAVERYLGPWRYLGIYLVSGLAGSAGALLVSPTALTVGASGAIFGIFGALFIIEYLQTGSVTGQAFTLILINLAFSFAVPNISWGGHVGGLIGGIVATFVVMRIGRAPIAYRRSGAYLVALALVAVAVASVLVSYLKVRGYA